MASSVVHSHKNMKRMQSKKSHSWWWDSHISPKNSKWLADNLEEMDLRVKQMLKLIEEDGESLAKKAEMYYQRRPELMSIVEEIYRMYRALAERYDHLTGELRKHVSWDQQSQSSGVSDISIDSPSTFVTPAPEKLSRRTSGPRAAGFEFFLGSGGSNSDRQKGDESSTLSDSESESGYDSSSIASYSDQLGNVGDQASARKMIDLETELRDVKEKLRTQQEENGDVSLKMAADKSSENLLAKIAAYEQQLKFANKRIQMSEEEIAMLNFELQRVNSSLSTNDSQVEIESSMDENVKIGETEHECEVDQASGQVLEAEILRANGKIKALAEELRVTKEKLQSSENEIESLRHQLRSGNDSEKVINLQKQLELAYKDVNAWKSKVNSEKKQVSKLQERIMLLKTSLTDRDLEVRELKQAVSDAEEKIFPEKAQIKAEMSKLLEERNSLVEQVRDWEARSRCLEDDIRKYQAERLEMKQQLNFQIHQLKADITERDDVIRNLELEKNALNAEVLSFIEEITSRDAHISELDQHLQQLHMEHVKLLSGAEEAQKLVEEMKAKSKDLEGEVERQRVAILESAEEKREAIRQLCFSLEHYRDGYQRLRQAVVGHSRVPVMAA